MSEDRLGIARATYLAFAAGERRFFEEHLSEDFSFSSPADPMLDRDGWFERCWPGAGAGQTFEFRRLAGIGDEVVVTYELRRPDGSGGCNTEILTFDDQDRIVRTEVYFGWGLGRAIPASFRLELVTVPVADVDRAKAFYVEQVGFAVEQDVQVDDEHRFVELMPPGSPCSIALTAGYVDAEPGSLRGVQVNVDDAGAAHAFLRDRGVEVSEIQEFPWGRFCFFSDPDGNTWSVHEPPPSR